MISCGDKKTYNNYRSSLQFTSKNKYFINTINTDYIKQGSKSKMSLMSPTSYQTAPTRDIIWLFFVTFAGAVWSSDLPLLGRYSIFLVGRVTRVNSLQVLLLLVNIKNQPLNSFFKFCINYYIFLLFQNSK